MPILSTLLALLLSTSEPAAEPSTHAFKLQADMVGRGNPTGLLLRLGGLQRQD
jgi:hypothetical protein